MKSLKFSFFLFFLSTFFNIFAQEDYSPIINRVQSAPFIFEGVVIKTTSYPVSNDRYIHTSNTVEITKIFKGNLTCGTVEIITKGGSLTDWSVKASHSLKLQKGFQGIFICDGTLKELSQIDFYNETNTEKLEAIFENQSFIKYEFDGANIWASDMWQNFDNLPELYNLLDTLIDTNYIECSNASLLLPVIENNNINSVEDNFEMPIYNLSDYNSLIANSEYKKSKQLIESKNTNSDNTLTYTLGNGIISGNNTTKYFEFDIFLSQSDNSKYFNNGLIRLNYDNSTFGNNIVANNKIQVTRGVVISDNITYADPIPADITNNEIAIPLTTFFPIPNLDLYQLSSNPEKVIHIKIEITNCNNTDVAFTNQSIMEILSFYGNSSIDTFGVSYDNIIATDDISVPACKTTITSFTPTTIGGGTRSILEIHGYLFGDSGRVYFPNADKLGNSKLYSNNSNFSCGNCIWSDNLIKMTLPSNYNYDSGDTIVPYTIGSGEFIVESNLLLNNKDTSDTPLDINFSIMNSPINVPIYLAPFEQFDKKYVFRCDTAIANYKNGSMKVVIEKALRDWTCATGIHWLLGADTFLIGNTVLNDTLNYITFSTLGIDPLNLAPVLAYTNNYAVNCTNTKIAHTEIDLEISDIVNWFCDTLISNSVPSGQRDFYAVILHELGHAHNLNHVINTNSIMNNAYNYNNRMIEIYNDNSTIQGGNWVINASMAISFTGCTSFDNIQLHPSPLCDPLYFSVNNINDDEFIKLFPNPTSSTINIKFEKIIEDNTIIILNDIQGKVFIKETINNTFKNTIQLNLKELNTGIYFLSVKMGNKLFKSKIIKR